MISPYSIAKVKDAASVVDVVGKYVTIKKQGAGLTGCCPFHNEKTPSFHVSATRNLYKCFGCGAGGDSIKFLMEHQGLTYIDAIKWLADFYHIELEQENPQDAEKTKKKQEQQQNFGAIIRAAQNHYSQQLWQHNRPLIDQLIQNRGFSQSTLLDFQIGYAPNDFKFLTTKIAQAGKQADAITLGLLKNNEDTGNVYDAYRHRYTIPILSPSGNYLGFAGRLASTGDSKSTDASHSVAEDPQKNNAEAPKWINPADSPQFNKSQVLFGLNLAAKYIRQRGYAVLVEGYFDCMANYDKGVENTVASMGTAFTDEQARILARYTKKVYLARDADKAGYNATLKDVDTCLRHGLHPYFIEFPEGNDPDTFARNYQIPEEDGTEPAPLLQYYDAQADANDGVTWKIKQLLEGVKGPAAKAEASDKILAMLQLIESDIMRAEYIATIKRLYKLDLAKPLERTIKEREAAAVTIPNGDDLPKWVDVEKLYTDGFVMKFDDKGDRIGIYFKGDARPNRLTNYVIKPLYLIRDPNNSRRLIEVTNGLRTSVVELPNKAFTGQDVFETEIVSKGAYYSEPGFSKMHYKRLVNWLADNMHDVFELKTLGWQPEGFFAFANKVAIPSSTVPLTGGRVPSTRDGGGEVAEGLTLQDYNEYGIVTVGKHNYLSQGVSKINTDNRAEDNIYENDLYLRYEQSPITFAEWAELFCKVYDEHAPFGIAFIFISAFKDIVTQVTKNPIAYFFGPKGSGKSAMSESMMWFFFSGLNAEGKLIQGYNLNPGQGTPFSFFNRVQRFRNVFMLFNEYDPTSVELWKKGAFKASYDGEGREVGSGDSGKKRKTEIQKVQCVLGIAGQYLDTTDDGSVLSRSVIFKFSLEKNKARTEEQKSLWKQLNDLEHKGISSLAAGLFEHRAHVQAKLKETFWKVEARLNADLRKRRIIAEARLLNNYSLCIALITIMAEKVQLPFTPAAFYNMAFDRISEQAKILKDNNVLADFWNTIQVLFSDGQLRGGYHFKLMPAMGSIKLKVDGETTVKEFTEPTYLLLIRMNTLHDKFAKRYREVKNKTAPDIDTLTTYLKDQPYFIGNTPSAAFKDVNTSAYVLNYEMLRDLDVVLEKNDDHEAAFTGTTVPLTGAQGDEVPDWHHAYDNQNDKK